MHILDIQKKLKMRKKLRSTIQMEMEDTKMFNYLKYY